MSTDHPVSEMSRTELESEVEELRQLAELIEIRGDSTAENATLEDIWIANQPIGLILSKADKRSKDAHSRIDELESESTRRMSADVRSHLLPIHKMWIDILEGDTESIRVGQLRAARLFGQFIRKECGAQNLGVTVDSGRLSMRSEAAKDTLLDDEECDSDLLAVSSSSRRKTVLRAMKDVVSLARTEDCDCPDAQVCDHGLVQFTNVDGTAYLRIKRDEFQDYLGHVTDVVDGDVNESSADDADDAGEQPVEATDGASKSDDLAEVDEELDRICNDGGEQP